MKRKYRGQLHSIYKLLTSTDKECVVLGLNLLKVQPIWANMNKHEVTEVFVYKEFRRMHVKVRKDHIDLAINSIEKEDPAYKSLVEEIILCLTRKTNYYSCKDVRNSCHGHCPLYDNYAEFINNKTYSRKIKTQKRKSNKSKHCNSRPRLKYLVLTRKQIVSLLKIENFDREFISRFGIKIFKRV